MKHAMGYTSVVLIVTAMSFTAFSKQEETILGRLYKTGIEEIDKELNVMAKRHCKLEQLYGQMHQTAKGGDKQKALEEVRAFLKKGKLQEITLMALKKSLMVSECVAKHSDIIIFLNAEERALQEDMQQMNMLLGILLTYLRIPHTIDDIVAVFPGQEGNSKVYITTRINKDRLFPGGLYQLGNNRKTNRVRE